MKNLKSFRVFFALSIFSAGVACDDSAIPEAQPQADQAAQTDNASFTKDMCLWLNDNGWVSSNGTVNKVLFSDDGAGSGESIYIGEQTPGGRGKYQWVWVSEKVSGSCALGGTIHLEYNAGAKARYSDNGQGIYLYEVSKQRRFSFSESTIEGSLTRDSISQGGGERRENTSISLNMSSMKFTQRTRDFVEIQGEGEADSNSLFYSYTGPFALTIKLMNRGGSMRSHFSFRYKDDVPNNAGREIREFNPFTWPTDMTRL